MRPQKDPLAPCLDAEGRLLRYPRRAAARAAALDLLAQAFAHGRPYTEPQVNAVLDTLHSFGDPAWLRRDLVDSRRLTRTADGRTYHRLLAAHRGILLRPLSPEHDRDTVAEALDAVGDYVRMERGLPPGPADVDGFFGDAPQGHAGDCRLHLAILDAEAKVRGLMAALKGHPDAQTWFLGFLAIDVRARGHGYGTAALDWLSGAATAAGATALRLCVIEENRRGRAFWERQRFVPVAETAPWTAGRKTHRRFVMARPLAAQPDDGGSVPGSGRTPHP